MLVRTAKYVKYVSSISFLFIYFPPHFLVLLLNPVCKYMQHPSSLAAWPEIKTRSRGANSNLSVPEINFYKLCNAAHLWWRIYKDAECVITTKTERGKKTEQTDENKRKWLIRLTTLIR